MPSSSWSTAETAVLRTVLYASLFEYPLMLGELREGLLECVLTEADILRVYDGSPRLQAVIEHREALFFPRGCVDWIDKRRRREFRSLAMLKRHRGFLRLVAALPFVRLVALSGSVAALNANRRADLDLFAIVKGAHAWTITLAVILLARLMGRRRLVCLNFVLSDDELALEQRDLFAANQIVHLRPLSGWHAYQEFLAANPFVREFYPGFRPRDDRPVTAEPGSIAARLKTAAETLLARPSRLAERLSRALYGRHLERRRQSCPSPDEVRLRSTCLKLHMRSHRRSVMERFQTLCDEALRSGAPPDTVRTGEPVAPARETPVEAAQSLSAYATSTLPQITETNCLPSTS